MTLSIACGPASAPPERTLDDGSPGEAEGTSGGETSVTGDEPVWPPSQCDPSRSPFVQSDCLAALHEHCRGWTSEAECTDEVEFDDGSYVVECAWATVVHFASPSTCEGATVSRRCEARLDDSALIGCGNACDGVDDFFSSWSVNADLEFVDLCGGPLGPWSAVGEPPGSFYRSCADHVSPPAPASCVCARAACEAAQ